MLAINQITLAERIQLLFLAKVQKLGVTVIHDEIINNNGVSRTRVAMAYYDAFKEIRKEK